MIFSIIQFSFAFISNCKPHSFISHRNFNDEKKNGGADGLTVQKIKSAEFKFCFVFTSH